MSKMIQIRNVPDEVHSTIKARAAKSGMSMSDYLKQDLIRQTQLPSMREWLAEFDALPKTSVTTEDILAAIDEGRNR